MGKHNNIKISMYRDAYCQEPDDIWEFKWKELKRELLELHEEPHKMDGVAWSPAILKSGTVRESKNVKTWSVLPLNFNNKPYGPVRAALKKIGCAAVAHSTFSNSKDANYFRVVLRLSRPLRRWEALVFHEFMNHQLGGTATAVRTLAPLYFLPNYSPGREKEAFAEEFYGYTLDVEHVWKWLEGEEDSEEEDNSAPVGSNRP